MNPGQIVISGDLLLAIPIALLAGLLSALSPCVLPLMPAYLGLITGVNNPNEHRAKLRVLGAVGLFILGFSLVFIALNTFTGTLGGWLIRYQELITRIAGVVVILMGLVFVGMGRIFQRTIKIQPRGRKLAPLVLGFVFAIGWTPCMGPTLVAVSALSLSGDASSAWRGFMLGIIYCLGLGIPFLLLGLGFSWATGALGFLRRHIRVTNIIGGALLILIGLAMTLGLWQAVMSYLQQIFLNDFHAPV